MSSLLKKKKSAFTLVEILIVIAILAILAVVTFVVINPAQRINDANDARRREDTNAIANGISLYVVDNAGALPVQDDASAIPTTTTANLFNAEASGGGAPASDLTNALVPSYVASMPLDPDGSTEYKVGVDAAGVVLVGTTLSDGTTFILQQ